MLDKIKNYVEIHYPTRSAKVGALVCASAAVEMTILAVANVFHMRSADSYTVEVLKYNLSANLGGAIFYGLSALNIIPKTAAISASLFAMYSVVSSDRSDTYLLAKIIGKPVYWMGEYIIAPIILKVAAIAERLIVVMSHLLFLPKHPIWIGVAVLGSALAAYKLAPICIAKIKSEIKHGVNSIV